MRWDAHHRAAVGGLAVLTVVVVSLLVSPETVFGWVESVADDPWLFAGALLVCYVLRPFVAWPTTLLSIAVGYGYGVALGFPIALVGTAFTSLPVFFGARWVDGDGVLDSFAPVGRIRTKAKRYFETTGDFRGVTAGRLAPIPADAVTATAAVSGVSLPAFVAATMVGELPWTVAAVVVGSSADTISTDGLGAVGLPLAVAMVVSAGVLLAGPAYETLVQSAENQSSE
ncbi:TVP38/TMEM64 family protein [Haloarchaeobius sp. DFWS5]|uniref:TVP38/TMEM64 family protein n=1 Tax=Haloarchaeobius sp. DFWS5 TaxID=3446114 RepID=UPI003EB813CB